ncbi:OLC1v1024070C1 [Oldenlandia corymbosa var. corymbosa]|uniref:OLC1v1024070C1 n=1 Tax=Oldenlandia corymbosa var. corymbosa TaxID=529605 RepID=A0AAV1C1F6_OLDCO|nr:OLC1v1024070C1 [Oldenlandia corymbosa var. corymbosa]
MSVVVIYGMLEEISLSLNSAGVKDGEDGRTYAVTMYFVGASFVAFVLERKWKGLSRSSNSLLIRSMSRCFCCVDKGKKSDGRFSFICVDTVDEVILCVRGREEEYLLLEFNQFISCHGEKIFRFLCFN